MPQFSVIIPVYNRPDEIKELLESLRTQSYSDFEAIIVEDGSSVPCGDIVREYQHDKDLDVKYYYKDNEGRSIARNYGLQRARGDYFIFFDSDCVIPPDYFTRLRASLATRPLDCFGGPDAADDSFSDTQKAINYAMTSFLTTGGIRGGKISLEKFTPRSFNMGYSREVYNKVGGFREMFSEDIDMSTRIRLAGFSTGLIPEAKVWHRRRVDFHKFARQVYVFGMSRITLKLLYPDSLKLVHTLPAMALITATALTAMAVVISPWLLLPMAIYFAAIFIGAWFSTKSFKIAAMALPAAAIQIGGYGYGFIKAYFTNIILGRGRDIEQEIQMRKGK